MDFIQKIEIIKSIERSDCSKCKFFGNFNDWSLSCSKTRESLSASGTTDNKASFYNSVVNSDNVLFNPPRKTNSKDCSFMCPIESKKAESTRRQPNQEPDERRNHRGCNIFGDLSFGLFDGM